MWDMWSLTSKSKGLSKSPVHQRLISIISFSWKATTNLSQKVIAMVAHALAMQGAKGIIGCGIDHCSKINYYTDQIYLAFNVQLDFIRFYQSFSMMPSRPNAYTKSWLTRASLEGNAWLCSQHCTCVLPRISTDTMMSKSESRPTLEGIST